MKPNLVDRLVTFMSPSAGIRRMRARAVAEVVTRHYEAADHGRRTRGWKSPGTSAAAAMSGLSRLQYRGRDLRRNNSWASLAIAVLDTRIVGTGIVATPTDVGSSTRDRAASLWRNWSESLECSADGTLNFPGLQSLAAQQMAEVGEVLLVREWVSGRRAGEVPFRIRLLEAEHLDTMRQERGNGGARIEQGVEFDARGRRVAYWIFPNHPGALDGSFEPSRRVPARDVIHLFRVERGGQVRGVPWGAPCLLALRDFDELQDAALVQKKIAACVSAFITDDGTFENDNATGKDAEDFDVEQLEPGMIQYLRPGQEVTLTSPPASPDYPDFARVSLMQIAAGFQMTYEALTGDLSRVNFSSGRMGALEFYARVERWRWMTYIPRLCTPTWEWFLEAAEFSGALRERVPVRWTAPRREFIDPAKEVGAVAAQVKAGLISLSEAQRELGYDPDELVEELARDVQRLRDRNLPVSVLERAAGSPAPPPDDDKDDDEKTGGQREAERQQRERALARNGHRLN